MGLGLSAGRAEDGVGVLLLEDGVLEPESRRLGHDGGIETHQRCRVHISGMQ